MENKILSALFFMKGMVKVCIYVEMDGTTQTEVNILY